MFPLTQQLLIYAERLPDRLELNAAKVKGILPHYQVVLMRANALDSLEVRVEVSGEFFHDEMQQQQELAREIERKLENAIGLKMKIKLVEPGSIERSEGKAKRVIDQRQDA